MTILRFPTGEPVPDDPPDPSVPYGTNPSSAGATDHTREVAAAEGRERAARERLLRKVFGVSETTQGE